ncbi:MAG: AAA family ATPase [Solirubrobacterales bacterium]
MALRREEVADRLRDEAGYLADRGLATVIAVALALRKPLLLEGEAGVGKTECAKAIADILDRRLIRLQCYEGIDIANALYDWNYARQMLYIRTLEAADAVDPGAVKDVFGPEFLSRRPLLEAIEHDDPAAPVLLIDEIDRADDEFEAFLLELLADFQVTIPEIGTVRADEPPIVVLTSNRTRELHDALKRRCLYHWIGYPSVGREVAIVHLRLADVPDRLAREAVCLVASLRGLDLFKAPGTAETLDWIQALLSLRENELHPSLIDDTIGSLLKHYEDIDRVRERGLDELLPEARHRATGRMERG